MSGLRRRYEKFPLLGLEKDSTFDDLAPPCALLLSTPPRTLSSVGVGLGRTGGRRGWSTSLGSLLRGSGRCGKASARTCSPTRSGHVARLGSSGTFTLPVGSMVSGDRSRWRLGRRGGRGGGESGMGSPGASRLEHGTCEGTELLGSLVDSGGCCCCCC